MHYTWVRIIRGYLRYVRGSRMRRQKRKRFCKNLKSDLVLCSFGRPDFSVIFSQCERSCFICQWLVSICTKLAQTEMSSVEILENMLSVWCHSFGNNQPNKHFTRFYLYSVTWSLFATAEFFLLGKNGEKTKRKRRRRFSSLHRVSHQCAFTLTPHPHRAHKQHAAQHITKRNVMETTVVSWCVHTQCSTVQIMEKFPFFELCCAAMRPVWPGRYVRFVSGKTKSLRWEPLANLSQ